MALAMKGAASPNPPARGYGIAFVTCPSAGSGADPRPPKRFLDFIDSRWLFLACQLEGVKNQRSHVALHNFYSPKNFPNISGEGVEPVIPP